MAEKVKMYWSKRNKDWTFNYPDRSGKLLMGVFVDMLKTTGHRTDWQQDLKTILRDHGYDPDTFQITCKKLTNPTKSRS